MTLNENLLDLDKLQKIYQGFYSIAHSAYGGFSTKYEVLWQHNNTRLLKFCCGKRTSAQTLLFIPSLLNKGYILDIMKNYSLIEFLSNNSCNCFFIDWGNPVLEEAEYTIENYLEHKVLKIILFLKAYQSQNLVLIGHCLGGIIATITASLNKNFVKGLALIATPWDFSCYSPHAISHKFIIDYLLENHKLVSSLLIRNFFLFSMTPEKIYNKFTKFTAETEDFKKELFIKVEKWSLDNMYLSRGIFRECIYDFIINNNLMQEQKLKNSFINLENIRDLPCFFISGQKDTTVPYESSKPILKYFTDKKVILSDSGHIGMIIGGNAKKELWQSLFNWIQTLK